MSKDPNTLNDIAWQNLFDKYKVLDSIFEKGLYKVSALQMKEFREPRLMAKFDHYVNLPAIFKNNKLSILPITRGDYIISNFKAYHNFESDDNEITKVSLPSHIQSLDYNNITSETIAINCMYSSNILVDFLDDEEIVPTVSGRMSSGSFDFNIIKTDNNSYKLNINNSQLEIDAAFEGIKSLTIIEAKRDLSEDFLIRQLYYPYRLWINRITKPVRPVFFVYTNGIYKLYEYKFEDINNYNSLVLVKQKNYSIEDTTITISDIENVLDTVNIVEEPKIPFPQADSFKRVINLCELLNERELSRDDVTEEYAFDVRQTNYYTDAARYLGLVDKIKLDKIPKYSLSAFGKRVLNLNYKQRQLEYCRCILSHKVFNEVLKKYFITGTIPNKDFVVQIMKTTNLYNVETDSTFRRRASTVLSWITWIIELINE